jgi:hypothetical protein
VVSVFQHSKALYGDTTGMFRGFTVFNYLAMSEAGFIFSESLGNIVYIYSGTCKIE